MLNGKDLCYRLLTFQEAQRKKQTQKEAFAVELSCLKHASVSNLVESDSLFVVCFPDVTTHCGCIFTVQ